MELPRDEDTQEDEASPSLAQSVPAGYVGPLAIPGTGRLIWWTGRVAIGLRYEPPLGSQSQGREDPGE